MSGLLRAAVTVVSAIEHEERPVLVHCSDGWDRTPQIVALAELLLDPYYRTIDVSTVSGKCLHLRSQPVCLPGRVKSIVLALIQ
jgi:protein tyrosine phosphatase